MKKIALLGSTGSIGRQTLNVIRNSADKFIVSAMAAYGNAELLSSQANEFRPAYVGLGNENKIGDLHLNYDGSVITGKNMLSALAAIDECDIVVCAVTGMSAFDGVVSAICHGKDVALASKEVLVAGGEYIMRLANEKGVRILPVDSEHSAVWQCLEGKKKESVEKLILTASGGPFYSAQSLSRLESVTPEQAVVHPNWNMGRKISVDSATMMNKGLEIIEARYLFDIENIDYIIHPQSVIHSMVQFVDGSILAQMSKTTMELPILIALSYPERLHANNYEFDFDKSLTFLPPREDIFILPKLAKLSLIEGKNAPCTLNAANEAAVQLFLDRKIAFTDIQKIVQSVMEKAKFYNLNTCDDILKTHCRTYDYVMKDYKEIIS